MINTTVERFLSPAPLPLCSGSLEPTEIGGEGLESALISKDRNRISHAPKLLIGVTCWTFWHESLVERFMPKLGDLSVLCER